MRKRESIATSLITGKTALLRSFILASLIVAMLGPWAFDLLNVPAESPCHLPVVRLYGDFCGYPMSGFGAIAWVFGGFSYTINELIRGNIAPILPDLITLLFVCIIVFPFLSTGLVLQQKISRRLQILNLIVWGLACLASLAMFIVQSQREHFVQFFYLLWGIWLYILVAISTVIFEALVLRSSPRPSQPM